MEHTLDTNVFHPIGAIRSPYLTIGDAPHQGAFSDAECTIEIYPAYAKELCDVDHHDHLIVLYWLDRADRTRLMAVHPHTMTEHGVFATRSPNRPNPIGLSVLRLKRREENMLIVTGLDALDVTPVLDIKPFSRSIDCLDG
jgi:formylmethanofuran dehydrogenase subunit E